MSNAHASSSSHMQQYLIGFILAIALTAVPFGLVASGAFSRATTMGLISVAAAIQVLVHLRYFLHLSFSPRDGWFGFSIAFTLLILVIMIAGSLWILVDLNRHMMPAM
jgi:cytochrome o ubiquinol oxidase operon protein cyoD